MTTYRLYDVTIGSSLSLPELEPAGAIPDLTVRLGDAGLPEEGWVDLWQRDDGGPWIRTRRTPDGYAIRYQGQVDFHYAAGGRVLTVHVVDCPEATLRHFLLDQVVPLILSLDTLVLHASAVVVDGAAIAFAGRCGVGKSTLAALLEGAGHPIVSDDALVLRPEGATLRAIPPYSGLRLWPEMIDAVGRARDAGLVSAGSKKRRLKDGLRFHAASLPLERIYFVAPEPADHVSFAPLSLRDIAVRFLEYSFRLEQRDPSQLAREMRTACESAALVPAWSLSFPRDTRQWDAVARSIVAHARDTVNHAATSAACHLDPAERC